SAPAFAEPCASVVSFCDRWEMLLSSCRRWRSPILRWTGSLTTFIMCWQTLQYRSADVPDTGPSPRGLFFTGTDTGVGKTVVTAGVTRALRSAGPPVVVGKPVATGANQIDGRWLADDTIVLAEAAGLAGQWQRVTPWSFPDPVAPPLAAR